ncbi:hypothetical protein Plhal304r1_c099g0174591 [Plasmopara halstedii]
MSHELTFSVKQKRSWSKHESVTATLQKWGCSRLIAMNTQTSSSKAGRTNTAVTSHEPIHFRN